MSKTLREKYIEALTKLGHKEVKRTARSIVFSYGHMFLYLGSSGSLRIGATKLGSIPVDQMFKDKLLGV